MTLILLFSALASAWEPEIRAVSTAAPPRSVALGDRDGGRIVVGQDGRISILDAAGREQDAADADGEAVALWDVDEDGLSDVIACGGDGFVWVPWGADGALGEPILVDPSACSAVAVWNAASGAVVATSDGSGVQVWSASGGVFVGPADQGVILGGPPVLAAGDDGLAAGSLGDRVVYVGRSAWSSAELPAGVAAIAWKPGEGPWAAAGDRLIPVEGGSEERVYGAGAFAWADVDADGVIDLVAASDGEWLIVDASTWQAPDDRDTAGDPPEAWEWEVGAADALAVGHLDADACADIVTADTLAAELTLVTTPACVDSRDLDADGWTADDGDCDDADAGVHPDNAEICDGLDQDCDAQVDEVGLHLDGPAEVAEGDTATWIAAPEGCGTFEIVSVAWRGGTDFAVCEATAEGAFSCATSDDGPLPIEADALDTAGAVVLTGLREVAVVNVPPWIEGPGAKRVEPCGYGSIDLSAVDAAGDTVTFDELDAPWFVSVDAGGLVQIEPDPSVPEEVYEVRVLATDDDGGEARHALYVEIGPGPVFWCHGAETCTDLDGDGVPDDDEAWSSLDLDFGCGGGGDSGGGGCYCCCGGSNGAIVVPILWVLRRRQARRSARATNAPLASR
jgi:hypothetical protein